MPSNRRKRFDRKKAVTFELVYRPLRDSDGVEHTLRQTTHSNVEKNEVDEYYSNKELSLPYERNRFELGEFGLPDDGYDYSQHFRTIGGTGGVFVAAPHTNAEPASAATFRLREDEEDNIKEGGLENWPELSRRPEDERLRASSIAEIQRLRQENPDFDHVFRQLDSDDESTMSAGTNPSSVDKQLGVDDELTLEDELLPDDFIALANVGPAKAYEGDSKLAVSSLGINRDDESKRKRSAIDNQFEVLLRSYECPDEFSGTDEECSLPPDNTSSNTASESFDLDDTELSSSAIHEDCSGNVDKLSVGSETVNVEGRNQMITSFKPEQHAELQLTKAMDTLIDSHRRISVEEAFSAFDKCDIASRSIAKIHERERTQVEFEDIDWNSQDPEIETEIRNMYQDRERWDCETIISTYSNMDNHPSIINEPAVSSLRFHQNKLPPVIQLDPRTKIPGQKTRIVPESKRTTVDFGARRKSSAATVIPRKKGESNEEKRARKAAVKEAARARRAVKSEMKRAFAKEALVQDRHSVTLGKSKVVVQL